MRTIFILWITLCAALASINTQANQISSKDFLALSEGQRHWWLYGAVEGIGHLVYMQDEEKAKCVWNWYPSNPEQRKATLIKSFEQYPEHAPTSILIALLQRECGTLLTEPKK